MVSFGCKYTNYFFITAHLSTIFFYNYVLSTIFLYKITGTALRVSEEVAYLWPRSSLLVAEK